MLYCFIEICRIFYDLQKKNTCKCISTIARGNVKTTEPVVKSTIRRNQACPCTQGTIWLTIRRGRPLDARAIKANVILSQDAYVLYYPLKNTRSALNFRRSTWESATCPLLWGNPAFADVKSIQGTRLRTGHAVCYNRQTNREL